MQESFGLGNKFTKTFVSSHKRVRTQEVNGKNNERKRRKKEKEREFFFFFSLIVIKKS